MVTVTSASFIRPFVSLHLTGCESSDDCWQYGKARLKLVLQLLHQRSSLMWCGKSFGSFQCIDRFIHFLQKTRSLGFEGRRVSWELSFLFLLTLIIWHSQVKPTWMAAWCVPQVCSMSWLQMQNCQEFSGVCQDGDDWIKTTVPYCRLWNVSANRAASDQQRCYVVPNQFLAAPLDFIH